MYVNDQYGVGYRDSGSNLTLVNKAFIGDDVRRIKTIKVRGITGGEQDIDVVEARIKSPCFKYSGEVTTEVGVMNFSAYDILVGNEIFKRHPELQDTISVRSDTLTDGVFEIIDVNKVSTRASNRPIKRSIDHADTRTVIY